MYRVWALLISIQLLLSLPSQASFEEEEPEQTPPTLQNSRKNSTIIHNLSSSYSFKGQPFSYQQDADSLFTLPRQPREMPAQSIRIYSGQPHERPEMIRMRVHLKKDGRERVPLTTEWPYLFHAQLSLAFGDKDYGGSGFMVGPQHLLTAGHNVYDPVKKAWVDHIVVRLALNDSAAPFDEIPGIRIYAFDKWVSQSNPAFDMALVVLNQPIGLKTGWCGLLSVPNNVLVSEKVTITGYPGDKGFKQMWSMVHKIKSVQAEKIFYDIDTYGGQSGSAVWFNKWGSPYAVGVHAYGSLQDCGNSGSRISAKKLKSIVQWIAETKEVEENISPISVTPLNPLVAYTASPMPPLVPTVNDSNPAVPTPAPLIPAQSALSPEEVEARIKFSYLVGKAEQGDIDACFQLANCFYWGLGTEKELSKAAYFYKVAADREHPEAVFRYSVCLSTGTGVGIDIPLALTLAHRAAELNNVDAIVQLAECYSKGNLTLPVDPQKAAILYERAGALGHIDSIVKLANCYEKSIGVPINLSRAHDLYIIAAGHKHPEALYYFAKKYHYSFEGEEQDKEKARNLYHEAAEQGHKEALYQLALAYNIGRTGLIDIGIEKDEEKSRILYHKAAQLGHLGAILQLAKCYETGWLGIAPDKPQANILYQAYINAIQLLVQQGDLNAKYKLAECLYEGTGIPKNEDQALGLYWQIVEGTDIEEEFKKVFNEIHQARAAGNKYDFPFGLKLKISLKAPSKS